MDPVYFGRSIRRYAGKVVWLASADILGIFPNLQYFMTQDLGFLM